MWSVSEPGWQAQVHERYRGAGERERCHSSHGLPHLHQVHADLSQGVHFGRGPEEVLQERQPVLQSVSKEEGLLCDGGV